MRPTVAQNKKDAEVIQAEVLRNLTLGKHALMTEE